MVLRRNSCKVFWLALFTLMAFSTRSWAATVQTFYVTSNADAGGNTYTLRGAIESANTNVGAHDTIYFYISNTITVSSTLLITDPITINGMGTQVVVEALTSDITIFQFDPGSDSSILRNIAVIRGNTGVALHSDNNMIFSCRIGTDWADRSSRGNQVGIYIYNSQGNIIGGNTPALRNVISGNSCGIQAMQAKSFFVIGNYIGLKSDGMSSLGNGTGIHLAAGTCQAMIGGNSITGYGNVISQNGSYGIYLYGSDTQGNTICGNIIGLNALQTNARGNNVGINLAGACGNWIGLPAAGYGNVIAGSAWYGIYIYQMSGNTPVNNVIQNNFIGLSSQGTPFGQTTGILMVSANSHLIGGRQLAERYERNVISDNLERGVYVIGTGNTVCGNLIGLNLDGTNSMGNQRGIEVSGNNNFIGGPNTSPTEKLGNIISGNSEYGIYTGNYQGNSIVGNTIGLNQAGNYPLPNGTGILLNGSACQKNFIGESDASLRNVISGNNNYGVSLQGTRENLILGNYIGTNASGDGVIANGLGGIYLSNSSACLIGDVSTQRRNIICGSGDGLLLENSGSFGNTIVGNWIGLLANGAPANESFDQGIQLNNGANSNLFGYWGTGFGNLIQGAARGIYLTDADTDNNGLFGNTICAFSESGILLAGDGANDDKSAPAITYSYPTGISGTAGAGDRIEVFKAERKPGQAGGSLSFLGVSVAIATGVWSMVPGSLTDGDYVCALAAENSDNNTSGFSNNYWTGPTPTITPTSTITPTITPTSTITMTSTPTHSLENVDLGKKKVLAFPNPADKQVTFLMHLQKATKVKVEIFNLVGEPVAKIEESLAAGKGKTLIWNCQSVAAGIYLVRFYQDNQEKEKLKLAIQH